MANLSGPLTMAPHSTTERTTDQRLPLGARAWDKDGGEWVYVKAGATIAQYDAVRIAGADLSDVRPTSAVSQNVLGVADAAFAANEYGFVQAKGKATAKVVNSTAAGAVLASTATAGTLGIAVGTDLQGRGVGALVTGVSTGSAVYLF